MIKIAKRMKDIIFSNYRIVVQNGYENRLLSVEDFKDIQMPNNSIKKHSNSVYDLTIDLLEDNYLWIYATHGNPNPCPNKVLDKNQSKYKANDRTPNLVEMRHQFFSLFDFTNNILYISDSKKKKFIEKLLKELLNIGLSINTIFVDLDDFDKKIKELKSIKFTSMSNLFTADSKLNNAFIDLLGLGANIDFTIDIDCKNKPLHKGNILQNLKNRLTNKQFKDLIIIGKNEGQFEQIFNAGTFNKKIIISAVENDEKMVDDEIVKMSLLEKIKNV